MMGLAVNIAAASVLALSIAFYVFVYTMWLKRRTPQNIVIGGAAGAFPPVIGWAAVTGSVDLVPLVLFAIVFFWTPPHFWSLALFANDDYRRAGVPMLPVVAGAKETRRQIVLYTLLLVPLSLAPWLMGFSGPVYGARGAGAGRRVHCQRVARRDRQAGCDRRQPDQRRAGAGGVQVLHPLSVRAVRRAGRRPGWRGDCWLWLSIRTTMRRRRARNWAMLIVLLALVGAVLRDHHRQDDASRMSTRPLRHHLRTAPLAERVDRTIGSLVASSAWSGMSFAAIPLYRVFCAVTGYGGTPQIGACRGTGRRPASTITVRFNANTHPGLPWDFAPDAG